MKISKRILGAALALIMIFNVFAVGTFAATFGVDTGIKLVLKTDKTTYEPGEVITVTGAVQLDASLGGGQIQPNGEYSIGYNNAIFENINPGDETFGGYNAVSIVKGISTAYSAIYTYTVDDGTAYINPEEQEAYGWNTVTYLCLVGDGPSSADATAAPVDIWSYQIKIKDDAPNGTYTIGHNPGDLGYTFVNASDESFYEEAEYGTVTITVGTAAPAKPVAHKAFQVKATDVGNTDAATLGFKGSIDSTDASIILDKVQGKNKLVDITAVGCKIELNDGSSTVIADATTDTIYKVGDTSEYDFRAVVEKFDLTTYGDAEIKVTYYVVSATNGTIESDVEITTANAIMASK